MTDAAAIVLAAGQGTRMRSGIPKVMHRMCGRTLVGHVLAAVADAEVATTLVVVGRDPEQVSGHLEQTWPAAAVVVQEPQRGTGHAVRIALDAAPEIRDTVLVVPGDAPLLTGATLRRLLEHHRSSAAAATLLTARLPDPRGYGRVVRAPDGAVTAIVEERDADPETRAITEVGTSVYAFEAGPLRAALRDLPTDNSQAEEYLTDVVARLAAGGEPVAALTLDDEREVLGVNDRVELARVRRLMRDRLLEHWMIGGATVTDPQTTWLGVRARLAADVTVHQNTQLHGATIIEPGAVVGPNCTLTDTTVAAGAVVVNSTLTATSVGPGARVTHAVCDQAEIGPGAAVGPFTYLRPGTRLGRGAKAGGFVEIKASEVGDEAKVPHLSYVGDATIGERTNIGAATVFVNYDGQDKHHTTVGDDVRIGSDTMLVAPVQIGDGAYTAAGSVITEDVPPGAMGVGRARQRNVEGWVERKRSGSRSAEAARRAKERDANRGADT